MTNRRSFFGKLLGGAIAAWLGPKVVKAEPEYVATDWRVIEGGWSHVPGSKVKVDSWISIDGGKPFRVPPTPDSE